MNSIISDKQEELRSLCVEHKLKFMYVFGSAASGKLTELSDIDFLISFKEISIEEYTEFYFNLHYKLQELFGRPVDLITENSLSNPYFKHSVENTKKLIYAA